MHIALLASGDGTEIMRHRMKAGTHWTLLPETRQEELQYCFVIHGELRWQSRTESGVLRAGESLEAHPMKDSYELYAQTDTEYLFVCSRPVFHLHSKGLREIEDLAVAIEQKDGYTADHCSRIQTLSMKLADTLGVSPEKKFDVKIGSFLHDVGKVLVPDSILKKPGPLSPSEWDIMRLHPVYGRDMVNELKMNCLSGASIVIEQHHERYDGSGYPNGLKGDEIHIGAAIIAVVDSFDAMTTDRVYRKAISVNEAFGELRRYRGIFYHPQIVDAFLSHPLGD